MKKMMRTAAVLAAMVLALVLSACSNSVGDDRGNRAESEDNTNPSGGGLGGVTDDGSGDKTGVDKIPEGGSDSPAEIPFETGKYFTAKGVSDGIEITISPALKLKKDGGSYISVDGVPLIMRITPDVNEYVFPFTENNKTYNVNINGGTISDDWVFETVKCVAGGGIDYTEYVNVAPIENSKLTISYYDENSGFESPFKGTLELDFTEYDCVITNSSIFKEFSFKLVVLLGKKDWSNNPCWWRDETVNYLSSTSNPITVDFDRRPTKDDWRVYNYEYVGLLDTIIKLNKYPEIEFAIETLWSEQMQYEPKSGN